MSTFLDELETELDRAAGRLVAGRRRRAGAAVVIAAAIAAIVVLAAWPNAAPVEREAEPAAPPEGLMVPGPPPSLADVPITVTGDARSFGVEGQLGRAGWRVPHELGRVPEVHGDVEGMVVVYGTGSREQAELAARTLGIGSVESAERPAYDQLREEPLSVVVGEGAVFPGALAAYRARFSVLGPDGAGVADSEAGPVRVYVSGADLCTFDRGGGTCAPFEAASTGRSFMTVESEGGDVHRITGVVPDGIAAVDLGGERVPVHDNVWTHGPTEAGYLDVPGTRRIELRHAPVPGRATPAP